MNAELRGLYPNVIVDHSKRPRNFRVLGDGARAVLRDNPLCGDSVTVYAIVGGDVLRDVGFQGYGCAVVTASASLMTEAVKGRSLAEVAALRAAFETLVRTGQSAADLGALGVFAGVSPFPSRIQCALIPWQALVEALAPRPNGDCGATQTGTPALPR